MAEGILKKKLKEQQIKNVPVTSAGTMAPPGMAPTNYALMVSVEHGIDISKHRSAILIRKHVVIADLILVMEKAHRTFIEKFFPESKGKVFLLKSYESRQNEEIDDPIGQDLETYRRCYDELEREIERILPFILKKSK
jgi:protein-tyrosine-phosphatase